MSSRLKAKSRCWPEVVCGLRCQAEFRLARDDCGAATDANRFASRSGPASRQVSTVGGRPGSRCMFGEGAPGNVGPAPLQPIGTGRVLRRDPGSWRSPPIEEIIVPRMRLSQSWGALSRSASMMKPVRKPIQRLGLTVMLREQ